MTKRMNWRKAALSTKRSISVRDEEDGKDRDSAARWLKRFEQGKSKPKGKRR